ncbi:hypothetical protein CH63R_06431 [Colletotrichum higginsianum IMI 349063]|uniref:Uncharacterized protein n=1 Tax=Colletotrichum higginsianum (strain IMI 349063) TaxID=759273 RepID=A0A1B7YFB7_COLHI|nr:hypothetical protein CH63R_06431 [Colletotrichum higginsianum IMI 349063]OBR10739.1 hypothetical protein CH63R_06431 [Colletotrichum higginsianum IMI 349063]
MDGGVVDPVVASKLPRFKCCLPPPRLWTPDREHWDPDYAIDTGGHPPIEGCDRKYVGWAYFSAVQVVSLYNGLHGSELDDDQHYHRPAWQSWCSVWQGPPGLRCIPRALSRTSSGRQKMNFARLG